MFWRLRQVMQWLLIPALTVLVMIATVLFAVMPVYTDEVLHKAFISRTFIDGGKTFVAAVQCLSLTSEVPWFAWPHRFWNSMLYSGASLLRLRLLGIGSFFAWLPLLALVSCPSSRNRLIVRTGFLLSLVTMGVSLPILAMNRPEQSLVLILGAALLVGLKADIFEQSGPAKNLLFCAWVLLTVTGADVHGKWLFFLPLFLFVGLTSPVSRILRFSAGMLFLVTGLSGLRYWSGRSLCPEVPRLAEIFSTFFMRPAGLARDPANAIRAISSNLAERFFLYFDSLLFHHKPQGLWLSAIDGSFGAINCGISIIIGLMVLLVFLALVSQLRKVLSQRHVAISVVLLFCSTALWGLQIARNFYEAALALPLLIGLFCLNWNYFEQRWPRVTSFFFLGALVVSVSSQVTFIYKYGPVFDKTAAPLLLSKNDYQRPFLNLAMTDAIESLAAECGLTNQANMSRILVDDATYPHFSRTRWPYFSYYLSGYWGLEVGHLSVYLERHDSPGGVSLCESLPDELRTVARSQGALCCFGRSEISAMAARAGKRPPPSN